MGLTIFCCSDGDYLVREWSPIRIYDIKLNDRNDISFLIHELFYSIEDTVYKESINVLNNLFDGNTYLRFSNIVLNTEQKNGSEDSNYGIKGTLRQFIDYFESYFDDNKENFSIRGCESSFNNSLDECICYKSKEETIHNFIKSVYSEYRLDFGELYEK